MEEYRDIKGFPNYEVSNLGNVRNKETKVRLKPHTHRGYNYVGLSKNGKVITKPVHRLVCLAFIPNPFNKAEVDHINAQRSDNRADNLQWVTRKENCNNPITRKNKSKAFQKEKNPMYHVKMSESSRQKMSLAKKGKIGKTNHSIPVIQYSKDNIFIKRYESAAEAARALGGGRVHITRCCRGVEKSSMGYKWKYEE